MQERWHSIKEKNFLDFHVLLLIRRTIRNYKKHTDTDNTVVYLNNNNDATATRLIMKYINTMTTIQISFVCYHCNLKRRKMKDRFGNSTHCVRDIKQKNKLGEKTGQSYSKRVFGRNHTGFFITIKMIKIRRNKILGEGCYGQVFKGVWNGKKVAVKRIYQQFSEHNIREELTLKRLNHPNVLKLLHVENDEEYR